MSDNDFELLGFNQHQNNTNIYEKINNNRTFLYIPPKNELLISEFRKNQYGTYSIKKIFGGIVKDMDELKNLIKQYE